MRTFRVSFLIVSLMVFGFTAISTADSQSGVSNPDAGITYQCVGESPAEIVAIPSQDADNPGGGILPKPSTALLQEWVAVDTHLVKARINAGNHLDFRLNPATSRVEIVDQTPMLTQSCEDAVARAPEWLRADLRTNLSNISGDIGEFLQEFLAEEILSAEDPYVDEIAFCVAHISAGDFSSGAFPLNLLAENAEGIYAADEFLDYVRIVDHGEVGDDNYWTSLEYNVRQGEGGDVVQIEIDPYYYYWYVVHPRLSDDLPRYVNPRTGRIQGPPNGVFWRDYFMNQADDGYPTLRESMEGVDVLWSQLRNNGSAEENGAVGAIMTWIRTVLRFDAGNERPNQPVRIYALHMGRCGEHQDVTAAAGRAALIPVSGTSCWTNDHVWNEFYTAERWAVWEPVNNSVDDSLCYQRWSGGSWRAPAMFRWRGDGFVETVTGRYHDNTANLDIAAMDTDGNPVDGARVMLASESLSGGLAISTWGFTGSDGHVQFVVGETRNIYMRIESRVGNYPSTPNEVIQIIDNAEGGQDYSWSRSRLSGRVDAFDVSEADEIDDPVSNLHLRLEIDLRGETVASRIFTNTDFLANIYPGLVDFFICDEENYQAYCEGDDFSAFNAMEISESTEVEFTLPTNEVWHAVVSNAQNLGNIEDVEVRAYWYRDSEWLVDGSSEVPSNFHVSQNYPNPFNPTTRIDFTVPQQSEVNVSVFNIAGQKVMERTLGNMAQGQHSVTIDGSELQTGMYFYSIEIENAKSTGRMLLLK